MTIDEAIHKYEAMATDDELKSAQCYQKYINYQDHDYKTDSDWWRKEAAEFRRFVSLLKELEVTQTMIQRINHLPSAQPEQSTDIQDILQYLDNVIHPLVSPENWNVYSELHDMISNLPSAQPKINNQINLCDSCKYLYPACPSEEDDVLYGNGIGNDNICACNKYDPLKTKEDE